MAAFFEQAWGFEYAILPCLVAYLIFDMPIIVRRVTRKAYVPIYFAFFPAGYSDELLARYFDEDDFYQLGGPFPEGELGKARLKIIAVAVLSLTLTMTLSPLFAGLFGTYFLTQEQFTQFIWTLGIIKASLLLWACYDLTYRFQISDRVPIGVLAGIYSVYWTLLVYFTVKIQDWIEVQNELGGVSKVAQGLLDFVILEFGVEIVFVAVVGSLVAWWITERRENPSG